MPDALAEGIVMLAIRAIVRPKLKKANLDRNMLKNYRPVSNIPVTAKIMDKVVLEQLSTHLERNHLHGRYQSAYRRNQCQPLNRDGLTQNPDRHPEGTE